MPQLFHYTTLVHLPVILATCSLHTTDSNISLSVEHAGPDVVWLTTDPRPREGWLRAPAGFVGPDHGAVRITVDVPDAQPWGSWAATHGITEEAAHALREAAKSDGSDWWIVDRPIPDTEWVLIELTQPRSRRAVVIPKLIDTISERHGVRVDRPDTGLMTYIESLVDAWNAEHIAGGK